MRTATRYSTTLCIVLLTTLVPVAAAADNLSIRNEVKALDRVIEQVRQAHGLAANPEIDDLTFARRAWLDLGGRMPAISDIRTYLDSSESQRRVKLIDHLVGSKAFHSQRFNELADLFRIRSNLMNGISAQPYVDWLNKRIAANTPYDEMVRDLITASGGIWDEDNGSVGFLLRDRGMNEDHTALTVQVFLGSRIQCAQCHDHPDGYFSRRQFLEVAAFDHTAETRHPILYGTTPNQLKKVKRSENDIPDNKVRTFLRNTSAGVKDTNYRKKLPHDYQYEDGKPGQIVKASPLWGSMPAGDAPREIFATWVTSEEDPRFAAVLANRLWAKLFGRGLVEPLDDWRPDNPPTDQVLLDTLTDLVIRSDYDVELVYRILARTQAYQLAASVALDEKKPAVAGPVMRRLSAEQVWDSLVALTVPNSDQRPGTRMINLSSIRERTANASAQEVYRVVDRVYQALQETRAATQALQRAQRSLEKAEAHGGRNWIAKAKQEVARHQARTNQLMAITGDDRPSLRSSGNSDPWKGYQKNWVRASETRQPAPPTHFLRIFGQSDRETVNAASEDGSALQSLALMNGTVDQMLLSKNSLLAQLLTKPLSDPIKTVYQTILMREPTEPERAAISSNLTPEDPTIAMADLVWALVNSPEFLHHR